MAYKVHHWIRRFTLIKNVEISPVVFFQKLPRFYRCHFEHMFGLTLITFGLSIEKKRATLVALEAHGLGTIQT